MSSTPESTKRAYTPTPPEELLARAKSRSASTRHRRLLGTSGSATVLVALLLVGILLPSSARPSHHTGTITVSERIGAAYELSANEPEGPYATPPVAKALEDAEVGFSLSLLNNLATSSDPSGSDNVLVSPSSLATALAMLELGANGATEQGIAATLQTAGLSASEQAAGWHSLAALLAAETSATGADLRHEPELNIANALFLQEHFSVLPVFVRALSSEFQTGLWEVDFQNDLAGATNAINQWTSENTKGLIKKLFSPGVLNALTRLVLADAVYFHADWARQFSKTTLDRPFYPTSGAALNVPFMSSPHADSSKAFDVPVALTASYDAVELPYAGNKLSALVVMPTASSLSAFVASLDAASLGQIVGSMSPEKLQLIMPTFTERSDNQLNKTLSSMGMSQAFGPGADFTGITVQPPLVVQAVEQQAYLQVTPKGTTAAAVTGVAVGMSAVEANVHPIVIDHPFLFFVRDDATGAILFESMVENPAA
ncbi:MAG: serpin family protein [Acidimicrobiales bacterium]|jgi:serine protease inhibitor